MFVKLYYWNYAGEPRYNDIGLYVTSFKASDTLWYQLIPHS
jgi:hypothetical protein